MFSGRSKSKRETKMELGILFWIRNLKVEIKPISSQESLRDDFTKNSVHNYENIPRMQHIPKRNYQTSKTAVKRM
jgi:hypothetical protein